MNTGIWNKGFEDDFACLPALTTYLEERFSCKEVEWVQNDLPACENHLPFHWNFNETMFILLAINWLFTAAIVKNHVVTTSLLFVLFFFKFVLYCLYLVKKILTVTVYCESSEYFVIVERTKGVKWQVRVSCSVLPVSGQSGANATLSTSAWWSSAGALVHTKNIIHWVCLLTLFDLHVIRTFALLVSIYKSLLFKFTHLPCHASIGDFRFEYEYEIEYKNDFSILLCSLHIITIHTHFIPWTTLSA